MPVCWNGRRGGLKIRCQRWRVGSSPTTGTKQTGGAPPPCLFGHRIGTRTGAGVNGAPVAPQSRDPACAAAQVESHHRHHVRRTQQRSVSAVCVRAAKTAHLLRPSSFTESNPLRWASIRIPVRIWIAPMHQTNREALRPPPCLFGHKPCLSLRAVSLLLVLKDYSTIRTDGFGIA